MSDPKPGHLVRWVAFLTAVWTVPVLIGVGGHFFGVMVEGDSMPASHIIGHSLSLWYEWIPATPLIFWIHRRLSFDRRAWPVAAAAHVVTLAGVFFAQTWVTLLVGRWTGHISPEFTYRQNVTALVVNLLLYDMLIYGGVLAVAIGLDYARRYRDRDLRASQLETQLERARLEALQMQLQPHFLFNALNSVAMLVRRDRKQEALDVVVGFSELLRYVLDEAGTMDVPLDEELRFVRRYLDIEKVRHNERLQTEIAVAPAAAHALVPNLLLQPLVENALKHGIARLPQGGCVRISAERRGARLRIEVENDGPPLPVGFALDRDAGLGLRNLLERLSAFFGDEGRFSLGVASGGNGVLAVLEIPFRDETRQVMERAG